MSIPSPNTAGSNSSAEAEVEKEQRVERLLGPLAVLFVIVLIAGGLLAHLSAMHQVDRDIARVCNEKLDASHRCRALQDLSRVRSPEVTSAFVEALTGEDPRVRAEAARIQWERRDRDAVGALVDCVGDFRLVPVAGDPDGKPLISVVSNEALRRITGEHFGDMLGAGDVRRREIADAWRAWWEDNKEIWAQE